MRIGIYPRKSVYKDNSESISVQVKMCKDYANIIFSDKDLEFFVYDKDEGFSGKNIKRPSFQALMSDVESNKLDVVMVYKLDRISRNVQEFSTMYDTMQSHSVSFVSVKESFDTSTSIGRTVMYILASFAQFERETTSERVADNMEQLGSAGVWTGGKLPTGMTSVRKKGDGKEHSYLILDETKISLVTLLFDLIYDGYSITGTERYCRDHGILSQSGKFLNTSQIYNIVTNPVYCQNSLQAYYYFKGKGVTKLPDKKLFDGEYGLIAYGRTKGGDVTTKTAYDKWSIAIGIHKYAVTSEKWICVQERLGINKQVRTQKHEVGILKGVLRCKCGRFMQNRVYIKNKRMFAYYFCPTRDRMGLKYCDSDFVKIDTIDNLFLSKLKEIRIDKSVISPHKETSSLYDIDTLKKNINSTTSAINNLTVQLQDNISSTAAKYIIAQLEKLDEKLSFLNNQLEFEELRKVSQKTQEEEQSEIYHNICFFLDNFDELSYKEKNEMIKRIVKKCVLDGTTLELAF